MRGRHLLSIADLTADELELLLSTAARLKRDGYPRALAGPSLALLFEKPSPRTRVSFAAALHPPAGPSTSHTPRDDSRDRRDSRDSRLYLT